MITGSIARRYAKALFSLAVEQNSVEGWSDRLLTLKEAVDRSPDLREVLANPVYSRDQRQAIAAQLAEALSLDAAPANLVALLADRNRLAHLGPIVDSFRELADVHLGRLRAKVTSAVPLEAAAATAMADRLSAATQREVILDRVVDPALLGGVVAQVGSVVYDGSLRSQLEDLRRTLKQ